MSWCRAGSGVTWGHVLVILRQVVRDGEPGRLGTDEDVRARADRRDITESTHRDVDEVTIANDREEKRAASLTSFIMPSWRVDDQDAVLAAGDTQFDALYPGDGLEGCAGSAPAIRAVAVHGEDELVRY